MRKAWTGALALVGAVAAGAAIAQQKPGAPTATYWMTADTYVGANGGMSGALAMMSGGAPQASVQRVLNLQLSSTQAPTGAPAADHLPPPGLKAGAPLPLITPKLAPAAGDTGSAGAVKGRILVYWGCGEQARAGQPMVIDLAKPGAGAASLAAGLGTLVQTPPSAGAGRTYAEWPSARGARVPADGSLLGDHVVRGNYTPEIRFTLGAGQDFLAPVQLSGTSPNPAGVTPLAWRGVSGAQAYFASVVGADEQGDTVIWSSSEIPLMAGQLPDHLAPADLKRLIARKALMGPQTTRCAVPAQVGQASPAALLRVTAYGDEVDVSYPARPADPKAAWKPDYVVKVRYASIASAMLGLADDAGDEADEAAAPDTGKPAAGKKTRALLKGLGSILP